MWLTSSWTGFWCKKTADISFYWPLEQSRFPFLERKNISLSKLVCSSPFLRNSVGKRIRHCWCNADGTEQWYLGRVAYAANYRPVRIIDLGHINYRPPQNTNCACSVLYLGAWAELTSICHVVALHNTYQYIHNEYDYRTNSMQRSRGESLEA